jgi:hypothetical protein
MANKMGEDSIADVFYRRAESWRNIINPETGFATPRINGDWIADFDPRQVNLHFTEANSWQYSFVQQKSSFFFDENEKRLDALFSEEEQTTGRTQSDITGLLGQYSHGNEPSHHIAYLYSDLYEGQEKMQSIINRICDSFYTSTPDGLIGNEDCGQMSAWYVLSASGFYPVSPGSNQYTVGSCQFDKVKFNLSNGQEFVIANNRSHNEQVTDVIASIEHNDITNGGSLVFRDLNPLGYSCGGAFGYQEKDILLCQTPLIRVKKLMNNETIVSFKGLDRNDVVYYYFNDDSLSVKQYLSPIVIVETTKFTAFAEHKKDKEGGIVRSPTISATFYKKPNNWTCTSSIPPNSQYTGGGKDALIDGIQGTANWQAGRWQGYQNEAVTFDLDFKETKEVQEVQVGFLQDARSWILMPSKVEVYLDGKLIGSQSYEVDAFTEEHFLETITVKLDERVKIDKLEVRIYSAGKLPEGHQGFTMDGDAFFFVDEFKIK